MRLIIGIIFILIGSILIGSTINELNYIGNGVIKMFGAIFLVVGIIIGRKFRYKK